MSTFVIIGMVIRHYVLVSRALRLLNESESLPPHLLASRAREPAFIPVIFVFFFIRVLYFVRFLESRVA